MNALLHCFEQIIILIINLLLIEVEQEAIFVMTVVAPFYLKGALRRITIELRDLIKIMTSCNALVIIFKASELG